MSGLGPADNEDDHWGWWERWGDVCVLGGGLLSISPQNDYKAQTNPEEVEWAGSC